MECFNDLPISRLLQVPDEDPEFLRLDELKPHQLTELGIPPQAIGDAQQQQVDGHHTHHDQSIYYDLNAQTSTNSSCSMYMSASSQQHVDSSGLGVLNSSNGGMEHLSMQSHSLTEQSQTSLDEDSIAAIDSRKRKCSYTISSDLEDDTGDDSKSVKTVNESKKQNHSEIEKRRRDKMNTYITELSAMVPMCHAMSRKLDKLTVLRMAVQHLKTIRGSVHSYTEGSYKPAFLSDSELKKLILQAADGFLFVVGCDRGRILYVSESVAEVLKYSQADLLGQSWFDILHPKDVAKVKEQLSSLDLTPRERLIDAKTMLPMKSDVPHGLSRLCPGARRSFFCRMKCKLACEVKEESESSSSCHRRKKTHSSEKKYLVIQCTGYLKSWTPVKTGLDEQEIEGDADPCNLSCLVAIGRIPPNVFSPTLNPQENNFPNIRSIQFISRHAVDGKFLFIDQRATLVLGFLPQELLGTSMYEYYHNDDVPMMAESHKAALLDTTRITTEIYRFRSKDNGFIPLQSDWKSFKNPWTKEVEYLIAKNSVIFSEIKEDESVLQEHATMPNASNFGFFQQSSSNGDIQRIINSHVEASKIGRQVADQVLESQRKIDETSSESSTIPERVVSAPLHQSSSSENSPPNEDNSSDLRQQSLSMPPLINGTLSPYNLARNTSAISSEPSSESEMMQIMRETNPIVDPVEPEAVATDGNDEAAMAVIMSLLEADAGLGGPVDFTGIPWPLP